MTAFTGAWVKPHVSEALAEQHGTLRHVALAGQIAKTAVIGLLTLTACGSSNSSKTALTEPPTTATTTSVAPVTTTSVKTASVQQVASLVARHQQDLRVALRDAKACTNYGSRCDALGGMSVLSLQMVAETALDTVEGTTAGAVPAEVETLHRTTVNSLRAVDRTTKDFLASHCDSANAAATCGTSQMGLFMATRDLEGQLNAWQPYL